MICLVTFALVFLSVWEMSSFAESSSCCHVSVCCQFNHCCHSHPPFTLYFSSSSIHHFVNCQENRSPVKYTDLERYSSRSQHSSSICAFLILCTVEEVGYLIYTPTKRNHSGLSVLTTPRAACKRTVLVDINTTSPRWNVLNCKINIPVGFEIMILL